MNTVYLLLGSNEGDRTDWLRRALRALAALGSVADQSSVYETAAWGLEQQPDFLNMVVRLLTTLDAAMLLEKIQSIEQQLGRQRLVPWGQRTLDIDILFFNSDVIETASLKVPHPYLQARRFTLTPLAELAPSFVHPILKKTVATLLAVCPDPLPAKKLTTNPIV